MASSALAQEADRLFRSYLKGLIEPRRSTMTDYHLGASLVCNLGYNIEWKLYLDGKLVGTRGLSYDKPWGTDPFDVSYSWRGFGGLVAELIDPIRYDYIDFYMPVQDKKEFIKSEEFSYTDSSGNWRLEIVSNDGSGNWANEADDENYDGTDWGKAIRN